MVLHMTRLLSGGVSSKVEHVLSLAALVTTLSLSTADRDLFWFDRAGLRQHAVSPKTAVASSCAISRFKSEQTIREHNHMSCRFLTRSTSRPVVSRGT